jgi:hypothetical protein
VLPNVRTGRIADATDAGRIISVRADKAKDRSALAEKVGRESEPVNAATNGRATSVRVRTDPLARSARVTEGAVLHRNACASTLPSARANGRWTQLRPARAVRRSLRSTARKAQQMKLAGIVAHGANAAADGVAVVVDEVAVVHAKPEQRLESRVVHTRMAEANTRKQLAAARRESTPTGHITPASLVSTLSVVRVNPANRMRTASRIRLVNLVRPARVMLLTASRVGISPVSHALSASTPITTKPRVSLRTPKSTSRSLTLSPLLQRKGLRGRTNPTWSGLPHRRRRHPLDQGVKNRN